MDFVPLLSLRTGYHSQCICVRASRVWHYRGGLETGEVKNISMVLLDEQGQSIYALVPANLVDRNISVLHETGVYTFNLFEVSATPPVISPVKNQLVIIFTPLTVVWPVLNPDDTFLEWTYELTSFGNLPAPGDTPRRFIDVIGVIRAISDIGTYSLTGRNVPTCRRQIVLAESGGNEIIVNLWDEAARRFNGQLVRLLGQEESAVVIFVGTTVHMSGGSKELAGALACRWYINEDIREINILRAEFQSSFRPIKRLHAPHSLSLRTQLSCHYPVKTLSMLLNQGFIQNQDGMFRCAVTIWRLTPGQPWWIISCTRCKRLATTVISSPVQTDIYICSNAQCSCTDASLEYNLHLLGSDGTGEAEFKLFGKVAQDIVGVSPRQLILSNYQSSVPITNLAMAASKISHTPPELAAVISWRYKFLLYVTNNCFDGKWASFNVHTVEACYPRG